MKKSNIFVHKKRALRVFAKNYGEVFEWEFESLPMGGSQRCQDWCQSLTHYCRAALPTNLPAVKTSKHFDRPAPTRPISIFVANTSLNDAAAILFFQAEILPFLARFGLLGGGQRRFWDNWPILWIRTPSTGPRPFIAVSPFSEVVLLLVVELEMRIKTWWEQWLCLLPGTDWWTASTHFSYALPFLKSSLSALLWHFLTWWICLSDGRWGYFSFILKPVWNVPGCPLFANFRPPGFDM